ncbi:MAG: hypothetical protein LBH03_01605 [Holophagales bacterium]|jgi:hypothetical protein|nr:hypothetical protein [Holophagales bacterium]
MKAYFLKLSCSVFCSAALTFFIGCSGGSNKSNVAIMIDPKTADLEIGERQTFTASVTGTDNTGVTWSLQESSSGGTLTQSGIYTAPMTAGTYHVIATSSADKAKSDTATVKVAFSKMTYTDPMPGNYYRFVKNKAMSTSTHLVLDLVTAGQSGQSAGLAFTISCSSASVVNWARVASTDTMLVQNGTIFNLGSGLTGLKATVENNQLKAVIAQKGITNSVNLNDGVLARVALDCNPAAAPTQTISLSVDKFRITSNTGAITTIAPINVILGTLKIN